MTTVTASEARVQPVALPGGGRTFTVLGSDLVLVGPAEEFGIDVPPVIEQAAQDRIAGYGEEVATSGRVLARAPAPEGGSVSIIPSVAGG